MKLVLKSPNDAPCEADKDFSVMILFDDSAAAERAEGFLRLLEQSFKEEAGRLLHQWWTHEVLAFTLMRELAALEAASADMIIIAIRQEPELRETVAAWMNRSLELRQHRPGSLVVLLDSDLKKFDDSHGFLSQLKQAAALGHMDFFATPVQTGINWGHGRPPGTVHPSALSQTTASSSKLAATKT
jgi:hypothetical protein